MVMATDEAVSRERRHGRARSSRQMSVACGAARVEAAARREVGDRRHHAGDLLQPGGRPSAARDPSRGSEATRPARVGMRAASEDRRPRRASRRCVRHTSRATVRHMLATRPRSWLIIRIAVPFAAQSSRIRSTISACTVTSSAVVGSSAISRSGAAGERDGDHHALAHAAGELVRVVAHAPLGRRNAHAAPAPRSARRCASRQLAPSCSMNISAICRPIGEQRIERRHRLLEDHGDAACRAAGASRPASRSWIAAPVELDRAAADAEAAAAAGP